MNKANPPQRNKQGWAIYTCCAYAGNAPHSRLEQSKKIERNLLTNFHLPVLARYEDFGRYRINSQPLLKDAGEGLFSHIAVASLCRLHNPGTRIEKILEQLDSFGIELWTAVGAKQISIMSVNSALYKYIEKMVQQFLLDVEGHYE